MYTEERGRQSCYLTSSSITYTYSLVYYNRGVRAFDGLGPGMKALASGTHGVIGEQLGDRGRTRVCLASQMFLHDLTWVFSLRSAGRCSDLQLLSRWVARAILVRLELMTVGARLSTRYLLFIVGNA